MPGMKRYYFSPDGDLLRYDEEEKELLVMERVEKVKVQLNTEVRLGDFEGRNEDDTDDESAKGFRKHKSDLRGRTVRHCKKCGETGHRRDSCPN